MTFETDMMSCDPDLLVSWCIYILSEWAINLSKDERPNTPYLIRDNVLCWGFVWDTPVTCSVFCWCVDWLVWFMTFKTSVYWPHNVSVVCIKLLASAVWGLSVAELLLFSCTDWPILCIPAIWGFSPAGCQLAGHVGCLSLLVSAVQGFSRVGCQLAGHIGCLSLLVSAVWGFCPAGCQLAGYVGSHSLLVSSVRGFSPAGCQLAGHIGCLSMLVSAVQRFSCWVLASWACWVPQFVGLRCMGILSCWVLASWVVVRLVHDCFSTIVNNWGRVHLVATMTFFFSLSWS